MLSENVARNIEKIRHEIAPYNPVVIAVTKYFDESGIIEYYKYGFRDFGENRVKDAVEKINRLPEEIRKNSRFHLIGHLQTNKIKLAVGKFYMIQSVDSLKSAELIDSEASKLGIVQKILLQINNANEVQKSGFSVEEIYDVFPKVLSLKNVEICGFMNMAPLNCPEEKLHELFGQIKQINDDLSVKYGLKSKQIISMGMSKDYRIALEEGATMIRLGRILFE